MIDSNTRIIRIIFCSHTDSLKKDVLQGWEAEETQGDGCGWHWEGGGGGGGSKSTVLFSFLTISLLFSIPFALRLVFLL